MTSPVNTRNSAVITGGEYFVFTFIATLLPIIAIFATWYFGNITFDIASALSLVWAGIYFAWGFRIIRNTEYLVIERFGKFSGIVHSGPRILCLPGLIDIVVANGTLRYKELVLFTNKKDRYLVDFSDCSTPVVMKASYRVGPQDKSLEETDNAIYLFTYTINNLNELEERIEGILESATAPQLRALVISDALLQKNTIADAVTADINVRSALEAIGVELNPQKGLIISDISLTTEIIALRQKKLQGSSEAMKQVIQGTGYAQAIKAIMNELNTSEESARNIYQTQRGLETLVELKTNVSFVSPNINDIQKTIGIGDVNPKKH